MQHLSPMTEQTLISAQAAISDKIHRLQGSRADAEKYAADPKTTDKEFWIKHAESMQSLIEQYEAAYTELNNTQADDR